MCVTNRFLTAVKPLNVKSEKNHNWPNISSIFFLSKRRYHRIEIFQNEIKIKLIKITNENSTDSTLKKKEIKTQVLEKQLFTNTNEKKKLNFKKLKICSLNALVQLTVYRFD